MNDKEERVAEEMETDKACADRYARLLGDIIFSLYEGRPIVCPDDLGKCTHIKRPARVLCNAYLERIAAEIDGDPAAKRPN